MNRLDMINESFYLIEEEATGRRFCVDTADRCWETALRLGWVAGVREANWVTFPARFKNDRCSIIPVDDYMPDCRLDMDDLPGILDKSDLAGGWTDANAKR